MRNFSIRSVSEFNKLANQISPNLLNYENRSTPRTLLGGKIYTATEYPAHKQIPLHNENSYTLVGWRFGGVLALEVARQLGLAGDAVSKLILIDSFFNVNQSRRYGEPPKNMSLVDNHDIKHKYTPLLLKLVYTDITLIKCLYFIDDD